MPTIDRGNGPERTSGRSDFWETYKDAERVIRDQRWDLNPYVWDLLDDLMHFGLKLHYKTVTDTTCSSG